MENQINSGIDSFQIFDLLVKYKRHWVWFVVSIMFCCGLAVFYVWFTPKSYLRTASIMIKDDSSIPDITTVFSDRRTTVLSRNSNVKNEVEAFQSPQLIQEVVRRLNLTIQYSQIKKMRPEMLYTSSPIQASFPDSNEDESFAFRIEFAPDSSFILSRFEIYKQKTHKIDSVYRGRFHEPIKTPAGSVVISPTSQYYRADWSFIPLEIYKSSVHAETRAFVDKLKVNLASKENAIIRLELTDKLISRAEDFLNMLIKIYDETWLLENNKVAVNTLEFLSEQLLSVEKEVKELDEQLQQYKSQHLLTDVRSAGSLYMAQSSNYSVRMMEINSQLSFARHIKQQLDENDNISTVLHVTGLNSPAIESQINNYNETLMERDKLLVGSENNPRIASSNERLRTMRFSITRSVDSHIEALNTQLRGVQAQEAQMTRQIASNPVQEMRLSAIQRDHETKVNQYVGLLQKKLENDMALVVSVTNTRIISSPSGNNNPVAPKKKLIMLIALFFGISIPAGFIWGKENLDTTIRDKKDLEGLSVPLLGTIALADRAERNDGYLLVQENGKDALNETFRMVRTNLDNICAKNQKVVMFTSLEPGSGKTFTALNLAMTLALAGKKIALLDLDLRTATLSSIISMPEMGIVDFLNERTSDEHFVIQKEVFYTGFDVIPVGIIPPNPTEMLMSDRFKVLIEKLKTHYDYIYMDITPLDMVADATIVAKYADISVFVLREGHTDRRKLATLEETYQRGHFKKMMLVLNGSKQEIYNKHHTYYKKVKNVALLPREAYTPGKTKLLTDGTKRTRKFQFDE